MFVRVVSILGDFCMVVCCMWCSMVWMLLSFLLLLVCFGFLWMRFGRGELCFVEEWVLLWLSSSIWLLNGVICVVSFMVWVGLCVVMFVMSEFLLCLISVVVLVVVV